MNASRSIPALLGLLLICACDAYSQAPGCPDVNAGPDQNLNCTANCTTLSAYVFQSGATDDYAVSSIPYAPPFPFTGGTQIFINIDDEWTSVINLPFNFCFYGNMYNKLVIGTNGVLSFDLSLASNWCEWNFTAPIPTPGPPPYGIYNNSVNGAYHDIDPSVSVFIPTFPFTEFPANINYAVLGTAPCRTFVVNFGTVPHYDCNSLESTQQIVLYETTNVIEVYIDDKPTCTTWNSGNAVIGLQNIDGTKGITAPGRNTGPWTAYHEAWRFTPSGTSNWTLTWYDAANNVIGNTATINVCPTGTSTYKAEAVYTACDGTTVVKDDQVTINIAGGFTTSLTKTDESCTGCDGTATVTVSGGTSPFNYDIGNGPQANGTFTGLCSGNYAISVGDAANCSGTVNVIINPSSTINVAESSTNEGCLGMNDGTITLIANGGTDPYNYDIGFGAPNNTGLFTGLSPNSYTYVVTDALNCSAAGIITIAPGTSLNVSALSVNATCGCDGIITVTASGGSGTYQYSMDNGISFQASNTFSNVCQGNYNVIARDGNGCSGYGAAVVGTSSSLVINAITAVSASCYQACDGAVNIDATGAMEYSIDSGSTFQSANAFDMLCAGRYAIVVTDGGSCRALDTVTISEPAPINVAASSQDALCAAACNGSIDITAGGGIAPYQYSADNGVAFQSSNLFSNICAGTYDIVVADDHNCRDTTSVTVSEPAALNLLLAPDDASCYQVCDGSVQITASGGILPYSYALPGASPTNAAQINNLCAGNYILTVTDDNNCSLTASFNIGEPPLLSVNAGEDDSVRVGESLTLFPAFSDATAVINVEWSPNIGLSCNRCMHPEASPPETQIYTMTVTDVNGCIYTDDVQIIVYIEPLINIPNAFSPNGDLVNDVFYVNGREIESIHLYVFNRWGEKLFETTDLSQGWDGTYLGRMTDAGVYVYMAEVQFALGKKEILKGSLTLLR